MGLATSFRLSHQTTKELKEKLLIFIPEGLRATAIEALGAFAAEVEKHVRNTIVQETIKEIRESWSEGMRTMLILLAEDKPHGK